MRKFTIRIMMILLLLTLTVQGVSAAELLIPGGALLGMQLSDGTVTVAAFDASMAEQLQKQGLQVGDRITALDGARITDVQQLRQALNSSSGTVTMTVLREGNVKTLKLTPQITPEGPRLGVYLKQGITGVGTLSWYDPQNGSFGALGHGVNTPDGAPVAMTDGQVYRAQVRSVRQGTAGAPGQLSGAVSDPQPIGQLDKNTPQGVFGKLRAPITGEPLPVGEAEQVHTGAVTIRSTVGQKGIQEYSAEILRIYPGSGQNGRNLLIRITDPSLLQATGGIVQGMSGSPIIQDGKLVGAVTHVLVNDPTRGYGIFIENMLDAAS